MQLSRFRERQGWANSVYPSIRTLSSTMLLRAPELPDKDLVWELKASRATRSNDINYLTVRDADLARYWLYFDLNPEASDQKVRSWFRAYLDTPFQQYEEALEVVYELTRRNVITLLTVSRFKSALRRYEISCNVLLGPTWPSVEDFLIRHQDSVVPVNLVREVLQWTRLNCRTTIDNPALEQAAIDDYECTQSRLRLLWSLPDEDRAQTCKELRSIIREWIPRSFRPAYGHHGNGAVAEEVKDKLASIKCHYLNRDNPILQWYMTHYDVDVKTDLPPFSVTSARPPLVREARFTSVAKNLLKRRGIAPQPTLNMWLQQGILDALYEQVWSSPYIRRHFPIFTREVNQHLALKGSRLNCNATLDLKAASDSITVPLVKAILPARLAVPLLCTRCTCTTEHPNVITYGNMGDATVFPVETIVIGAIAKLSLIRASVYDSRVNIEDFSVFGDDVVLPNHWLVLHEFHVICDEVGLLINDDKSFTEGPYRESCGVEAWLGLEVQPFYLFNRAEIALGRAERLAQLIGRANNAMWRGLKWLRLSCLHQLEKVCYGKMELIPFTEDPQDPSRVYTYVLSDRGHFRRQSGSDISYRKMGEGVGFVMLKRIVPKTPAYQRIERESCVPRTKRTLRSVDTVYDEWYRYYMYLLQPPTRAEYRRSYVNHDLHIRKEWGAT